MFLLIFVYFKDVPEHCSLSKEDYFKNLQANPSFRHGNIVNLSPLSPQLAPSVETLDPHRFLCLTSKTFASQLRVVFTIAYEHYPSLVISNSTLAQ